ncbi:rhomboid family intramembrane serine protease GlpG [Aeromonas caviae]|jgi:GlpG protein|uniref:Rhomboid family intramembrane serine protease GlpG n=1 Tax=Aeromonas caviae TaxID=648 RepID=A0AA42RCW5_AERCA|nr:rhomboid family intramembrane serine protease GlpG [Aeromonas caviae]MBL0587144.1 rhomboid family intramembrane serine protease GlpG [Aeromonas caviae]MDH1506930.1 rhomboid family intramembrane serine protease GlpG [Aeromonas caviae]MDH1806903.1 rhomboid family intramembrane serine protease GlpG [Aeromonas caviae]RWT29708.1 rhomboid family intramembrane serine protease GlpG [Aeromonas caviae]RWT36984.1 rhomboid family intramembrane serine protease GlpG [Aeromonas caviae]
MIQLLVLGDARMAQALVDYLATLGIPCELTQSELGVSVWLADERRLAQAQQEVKRFLSEPNHPRYMEASWQSGHADARIDYSKGMTDPVTDFLHQAGPLTLVVIIACLAIYALDAIGLPIFDELAFHPTLAQFTDWQAWRYVTPAFIHFSVLHLVFNLLWWWYLGGQIEQRLGSGKLFILLIVGAALPNIAEFFASGPRFGGLSGVVYALLGYSWLRTRLQPDCGLAMPPALMGFMLVWLVLGFLDMLGTPTANMAHLAGLLVGLAQGWLDRHHRPA